LPCTPSVLGLLVGVRVPGQPLLVELDDDLRAFDVGLAGGDEVRLVRVLPLHEEHQLPAGGGFQDQAEEKRD
jgi:hypothetical protein